MGIFKSIVNFFKGKTKKSEKSKEDLDDLDDEQSKILDGEKPTDPALFSKSLIDTIYSSLD